MTDIIIPAEVRESVAKAIYEHWRSVMMQSPPWEEVDEDWRNGTLGQAEAGIIALFMSWPDRHTKLFACGQHHIILPLPPQEITLNTHNINALAVKSAGEEITLTEQEASDA